MAPDAPEAQAPAKEPQLDPLRNALPVAVEVVDSVEALVFKEEDKVDEEEQDKEEQDNKEEQDKDKENTEASDNAPNF